MSIYSIHPLQEFSFQIQYCQHEKKIAFNDLKINNITIEARVVKPGRKSTGYIEKFRINSGGFDFKRHHLSVETPDEEYTVYIDTEAWLKTWHGISAEFQVLEFPESDVPKNFDKNPILHRGLQRRA